ncbi:hypothetical protein [Candidatus Sororendozoicomonas aggregata]|uniref:hypothetical protein n=1 Tax=Candidatus Sororendozoicomonas aggregata TaxID=3073239 RepID=UPI002ED16008
MRMKSILRAGKFMANKSFVFITGVLTLSIMGNTYGLDGCLLIKSTIRQGKPHFVDKGYKIKAFGRGICMYGVYGPASYNTSPYVTGTGIIGIHYNAELGCASKSSVQYFIVTNNETGKAVALLKWSEKSGEFHIKAIRNTDNLIAVHDVKHPVPDKLNVTGSLERYLCHP